jgi:hypothetical protein
MVDCLKGCEREEVRLSTTDISALLTLLSHEVTNGILERKQNLDLAFNCVKQIDNLVNVCESCQDSAPECQEIYC